MDLTINKELAELIGIILGDGSLNIYQSPTYSTYYRLKITLDSREKQYISHISSLIQRILDEKPLIRDRKNENTTDILIFKKKIILKFIDLGLVASPKWNRAIIPDVFLTKNLEKYILRGYFDTDGCVVVTNNNGRHYLRLEMKIQPSPMQYQLIEIIKQFGFKYSVYKIGKGKVRVQLNGKKQVEKWVKLIGFSNHRHIQKV